MAQEAHPSEPEALFALTQSPVLTWEPVTHQDLPELTTLYQTIESCDDNPERSSLDDLEDYWGAVNAKPAEDVLLGRDASGELGAVAWAACVRTVTERRTVWFNGGVRPDLRSQGIGSRIMAWQIAHAHAWDRATRQPDFGPLVMRLAAPAAQTDVRDLATRHGLLPMRHFYEMRRPLTDAPTALQPDGIRLTGWDPDRSDEARDVINAAFSEHWGHTDATPEMWEDQISATAFRPQWSVLALDAADDRLVGVAFNVAYTQDWTEDNREGYTEELAVLKEFRGRGIAKALLTESMRRFHSDAMTTATLGVDTENTSGALRLYESLGYSVDACMCHYQREEGAASSGAARPR